MSQDDKFETGLSNSSLQSEAQENYVHSPPDSSAVNAPGLSETDTPAVPQDSENREEILFIPAEEFSDNDLIDQPVSSEVSPKEASVEGLSDKKIQVSPLNTDDTSKDLSPDILSEMEDELEEIVEEEKIQLVVFTLADERYGVDIATVESVIKLQPITAVPQAPYFVEGLTNLRGTVLPVLDLRKRLGLPVFTPTKKSRIVVAKVGGIPAGLIVDSVDAVLRVSVGDIDPPSPINTATDSAYIFGIAKLEDQLIILLDLKKVLPSV